MVRVVYGYATREGVRCGHDCGPDASSCTPRARRHLDGAWTAGVDWTRARRRRRAIDAGLGSCRGIPRADSHLRRAARSALDKNTPVALLPVPSGPESCVLYVL